MPHEHESGTARTEPLPENQKPTRPLPSGVPEADRRVDRRSRIWGLILLAVIVLVGVGSFRACSWWNSDDRPLAQSTVDRSGPVVLKSIQDLARFQAATGTFQVVVDLEKDTKYVPKAISGQRTLFVGVGTVDAYVDFSGVTSDALKMSEDRKSVSLRLPPPALEKVNLDQDKSYVFAQERGVIDRFKSLFTDDPNKLADVYKAAEAKIADAAKETDLSSRAQDNTRTLLTGLFKSLGFTSVTVTFSST
ncbi:DUF4230 domain-containing protein [Cryptosporangium phraense]|uniref:DUF4230 domain-containing protein n=1 Tax=Cryptosporangium phraense TaxID=2593070 RepID=A0A545APK5_9ACTN|nr:DUF4230 domain-containing protein [Cryptosporangium phraense]TQS43259.1 DUF4230 domain-containing protein [Cryptosporangium phraense]